MSASGRVLALLCWSLLALALLLAGAAFLASRTVTLQWAAKQAVEFSGGRLKIEGIAGSVLEEISADLVQWIDDGVDVSVTSLRLAYQPLALLDGLARITRASAAQIEVTLPPSGDRPRRPRRPAAALDALPSLPPFAIERLEVGRLSVREGGPQASRLFELHGVEAVLTHDGERINAGLMNARLLAGESRVSLRGDAALLPRAPYATDGRFVVQWPLPAVQPQPLRLDLRLNGPLAEMAVRAGTVFAGAPVEARGVLRAFEPRPLRQVRLDLKDLDLARYDRSLPATRLSAALDFEVTPVWASGRRPWLIGPVTLTNAAAGKLDRRRLPLDTARAVVAVLDGRVEVQGLQASGPMGAVTGEGWLDAGGPAKSADFRIALHSEQLRLRGIDGGLPQRTVEARVALDSSDPSAGVRLSLAASDKAIAAELTADLVRGHLHIRQARVRSLAGPAQASFEGKLGPAPSWPLDLHGEFRDVDPGPWIAAAPILLNGTWQARGPAAGPAGGAVAAAISLQDSTYRALPLTGTLAATLLVADGQPQRLGSIAADLRWGEVSLDAAGSLGAASDQLRLTIGVPRAGQLDARLDGALQAAVVLSGPIRDPAVSARIEAGPLSVTAGGMRAGTSGSSLEWTTRSWRGGRFDLHAALADVELGPVSDAAQRKVRLGRLTATVGGAGTDHSVALDAAGEDGRLQASARGGLGPDGLWRGRVLELSASHPLLTTVSGRASPVAVRGAERIEGAERLRSLSPFALQVGEGRASVRDGRFGFPGASVVVRQLDWDSETLTVKADASRVSGRWLAGLADRVDARPPDAADLLLSAAIDFQGSLSDARVADWQARVRLQRESGDLWVGGGDGQAPVSAGLRTLAASATLDGGVASLVARVAGDHVGRVALEARTTLQDRGGPAWSRSSLSLSPLAGRLDVALNSFRWVVPLADDRWQVDGSLAARLDLGGTLTRPHADGIVTGSNLSAIEPALGLRLRNGVLAAEFAGDRVDVRMLRFEDEAGGGNVAVSGRLQAPAAGPSEARVVVDGLAIPLGVGQQLVLTGSTALVLAGRSLEIVGRLGADEGAIVIDGSRSDPVGHQARQPMTTAGSAPVQPASSDSTLRKVGTAAGTGSPSSAASRPFTIDTDVGLDLGRNVRVSGAGVDAGLSGTIRLTGRSPDVPRARGVVDLVDGSYRVDGRARRLDRGRVVYGEGPAGSGVELVAAGDGARTPAGGVTERRLASTVGPLLSAGLLAACEQSLRGVWGILKLQSEITDRLSLSVRAGSDRAMDLLWFFPFD